MKVKGLEKVVMEEHMMGVNKYRGCTSDATTSLSLIVSLIMMSFDYFLLPNMAIFVVQK